MSIKKTITRESPLNVKLWVSPAVARQRMLAVVIIPQTSLANVISLIEKFREETHTSINTLQSTVLSISGCLEDVETSLRDVESRTATLESLCTKLAKENANLCERLEDLESRSRRQNLRVIGIPENTEGGGASRKVHIFQDWPPDIARLRAAFKDAKAKMRDLPGVRYGLLPTAKLQVTFQGKRKVFDKPEDAETFLYR